MKEGFFAAAAHLVSGRGAQTKLRMLGMTLLGLYIIFPSGMGVKAGPAATGAARPPIVQSAQETISGTWTADVKADKDYSELQFTFNRRTRRGHTSMSGHGFSLDDFQSLTREQVYATASTQVSFRLAREAGTIECQGVFRAGKGSGEWRLLPNQAFRSAMRASGYNDLTEEQMFTAAMVDVTSKFVEDFKSIGFDMQDFQEVIKGRIFNITPQFAAEMKSLGFNPLNLEDLVRARIFKIDAEFVRQVQAMGFERQPLEGLVKLRIFKITPEFIREMKTANFENLTTGELVKLRIFEISPAFVKSLKAEGLSPISVEDAVKLKIHHVDDDFIRRAKASGYTSLSVEDLVRLSIHGRIKMQ
jgi:predicted metallopeptidase